MEDNCKIDIRKERNTAERLTIADWQELLKMESELQDKMNQYENAIDDKFGNFMMLRKVKDLQQQMTDVFNLLNVLHMSTKYDKGDMKYDEN